VGRRIRIVEGQGHTDQQEVALRLRLVDNVFHLYATHNNTA
jgi:hypothetical protein